MAYNVTVNLETKPKTCEMFSIVCQRTESKSSERMLNITLKEHYTPL